MVKYARQDTHYLLYIYDRLRNDIKAKAKNDKSSYECDMGQILEMTKFVCLKLYKKPVLRSFSYL